MRLRLSLILGFVSVLLLGSSLRAAATAITLQGSTTTFYPVFFRDAAWGNEQFVLSLTRADIHTDETWAGSLMAEIRSHSSGWGHGSDFLDYTLYTAPGQGTQHLVAGIKNCYFEVGVVIWLRGGRTYYYSANKPVTIRENSDTGAELVTYENPQYGVREAFANKTSPDTDFEANGATSSRNQLVRGNFTTLGNVGIGTTNPVHKLAVNGTIKAKEIIVETTGWSDYVFADNYALAPLTEVEAHIKEHKHLPGIPSASQVAEQGVSVGDMQARLLAKIEELTLHQIAQEKRAREQEKRLANQDSRIEALEAENTRLKSLIR